MRKNLSPVYLCSEKNELLWFIYQIERLRISPEDLQKPKQISFLNERVLNGIIMEVLKQNIDL